MCDPRDKPIDHRNHTDPISYVAAGTDDMEETDHLTPYAEYSVFKGVTGPVHAAPLDHLNSFWVMK